MRPSRVARVVLSLAWLVTWGCESGPSGPGALEGVVDGPANLGAVTLEVVGPGIRGFEGQGDVRAYGAVVDEAAGRHRVVLITPSGGPMRFSVLVQDVRGEAPAVTVLDVAGVDNRALEPSSVRARVRR